LHDAALCEAANEHSTEAGAGRLAIVLPLSKRNPKQKQPFFEDPLFERLSTRKLLNDSVLSGGRARSTAHRKSSHDCFNSVK
jgi:hypothetical protein